MDDLETYVDLQINTLSFQNSDVVSGSPGSSADDGQYTP